MNPTIAIIYLAAGASRRMGRSKALLPWRDGTIIAHHAALIQSLEGAEAWIVTQPDDPELKAELDRIQWPAARRVVNPDAPDCDMLASIQFGMRAVLKTDAAAVGIALVDQPLIRRDTIEALLAEAREHPDTVLQPAFGGRRGHPVLLPRRYAEALAQFSGPSLRDFLDECNEHRASVTVDDEGVITDLDTPVDYHRYADQQGALR